ncbi:hypothetical protein HHX47_DHR3000878 [Lentinula edodes]|nr:hypothetical protein HHX47_DHR3000878 [Lentinula edodes]
MGLLYDCHIPEPKNGSLGQFRTADDIFEEAASKLEQSSSKDSIETISAKDVATFASMNCCKDALTRICDSQGDCTLSSFPTRCNSLPLELPPDIMVYRFSPTKYVEYLKLKVLKLLEANVIEGSRTLVRSLAKDGLMEDGNEKLLEGMFISVFSFIKLRRMFSWSSENRFFSELNAYLEKLEEEKRLKAREASSSKNRKKAIKKEDSKEKIDKRKAPKASQGVEKLKKTNINGMAKLSTFFAKKS